VSTVRREKLLLPMSRLGAASNLPRFRWQQPMPNKPTPPNFGLSEEESRHGFNWGEDSILPYEVSDDYDRNLQPGELDVLVLDNGRLRAVVAPSLGGRLLELKDLATGRDLVFRNPVFQPANLAALNAWFSGGIEWNGLIPGHTPFTCAPVFAGVRDTPRGPVLRIYEFDRIVEATWQVDLFLPSDGACLYAHGRIVNPSAEAKLAYWWTNIAAPMGEGTRVLSPADYSVEHIWPGNNLGRCEFPRPDWDASYPDNWENATSVFFRAPHADRRFVMSVGRDGFGLGQTSTGEMVGRKFFYFGSAPGGQNWMDYLSRPGEGKYLEIQSGVAPTQNQRFVLGGGAELDWTEAFFPVRLEAGRAHDAEYGAAVAHAADFVDGAVPPTELAEIDAFLREQARLPLDGRVSEGGRAVPMRRERARGPALPGRARPIAPSGRGEPPPARGPSGPAKRRRALRAADAGAASAAYRRAGRTGEAPAELAVEIATHFMAAERPAELKAFVEALPAGIRDNERIILARAVVAADAGQFDELERLLLSRRFATIREGETLLSDLWGRLRRGRLEAELGRLATIDEIRQDLTTHPLPRALDLRMHQLED